MKDEKRLKLPRGLHWESKSQNIAFNWRDAHGKQHGQSTHTSDPTKALIFKLQFLERQRESHEEVECENEDLGKLPIGQVSEMYFNWKVATNSELTVAREKRMFKNILKFFGREKSLRSVKLASIRIYQEKRRAQISPTMKARVTARTVNYELQLLRGVMTYANCWTPDLATRYTPLRQRKKRKGKIATKEKLIEIITTAKTSDYWEVAMYCAAVAVGTGCRSCEIKNLQLLDIVLEEDKVIVRREIAKNRTEREPKLMALAQWGLRNLLLRAQALGVSEPQHYLLPFKVSQSSKLRSSKPGAQKWDVNRPMVTWVKSWRTLMEECGMQGFRFHDLRHTFRTLGAEAGVPLEVMMAQLGHMDRETSLEYVHIQQKALERAKQLIESEQEEILAAASDGELPSTTESENQTPLMTSG